MDLGSLISLVGMLGAFIVFLLTVTMWINRQFNSLKDLVYSKHEELKTFIMEKLEYHEHHDDVRFDNVQKDLIAIKLRNAAIDGKTRKEIIDDERSLRG